MAKYDELINIFKAYFYDASSEISAPLLASSGSFSAEDREKLNNLLEKQTTIFNNNLEDVKRVVSLLEEASLVHDQILEIVKKSSLVVTEDKTSKDSLTSASVNSNVSSIPTETVPVQETTPVVESAPQVAPQAVVESNHQAAPETVVETAPQEALKPKEASVQEIKVPGESVALDSNNGGFALSPIDEGVTSSAEAELSNAQNALNNVQAAMSQVAADHSLSASSKTDTLKELHRVAQEAAKAIVVSQIQLGNLNHSRDPQRDVIVSSLFTQAQPQQAPAIQPATSGASKEQEMQTMLAQANQLYGQGKTEEAAQLMGQVTAMNREQGQAYVKKAE